MKDLTEKIVKRDDIRAKTPEPLNEKVAYAIGVSLAAYLEKNIKVKEIVVGHDMRNSSSGLANALRRGITTHKSFQTKNLGQCSTEIISYAAGEKQLPAVMVTASHNPADYNGFKILLPGARLIGHQELVEIVNQAEKLLNTKAVSVLEGTLKDDINVDKNYVDKVLAVSEISRKGYGKEISIVIDAGNGMGAAVFKKVAPYLNWVNPIYYHDNPDGNFPSGIIPNPIDSLYMERLREEVEKEKSLLGIGFDGDADRAGVVYRTETGRGSILTPSQIGGLIAEQIVKKRGSGFKILYSLPCSELVAEVVKNIGAMAVMTPVGYSQVRERMAKPENSDCLFALEHSGHYFYRDFYLADSGMITALMIMDMVARLASQGKNLDSIIRSWQSRFFQSKEINFDFEDSKVMEQRINKVRHEMGVREEISEYAPGDPIDTKRIIKERRSLTYYPGHWWFCLRPSGTEPKLRLIAEVILEKEMPENQRLGLGPKILNAKMDQLINLVGSP